MDDEPAVHGVAAAVGGVEGVGVGMAAQAVVRLEQRDVMGVPQKVGGGEARDPGADHGHSWSLGPRHNRHLARSLHLFSLAFPCVVTCSSSLWYWIRRAGSGGLVSKVCLSRTVPSWGKACQVLV